MQISIMVVLESLKARATERGKRTDNQHVPTNNRNSTKSTFDREKMQIDNFVRTSIVTIGSLGTACETYSSAAPLHTYCSRYSSTGSRPAT